MYLDRNAGPLRVSSHPKLAITVASHRPKGSGLRETMLRICIDDDVGKGRITDEYSGRIKICVEETIDDNKLLTGNALICTQTTSFLETRACGWYDMLILFAGLWKCCDHFLNRIRRWQEYHHDDDDMICWYFLLGFKYHLCSNHCMVLTTTNCFNSIWFQNLNRWSSLYAYLAVFKSTLNLHDC